MKRLVYHFVNALVIGWDSISFFVLLLLLNGEERGLGRCKC